MPLYDFRCERCGEVFEKLVLGIDGKEVKCPKCKVVAKRQMGSIVHFEFKGVLA